MSNPADSKFKGFNFTVSGKNFFVGIFSDVNNVNYPALLIQQDTGEWSEIDRCDSLTDEVKASNPIETMLAVAVNRFNVTIAAITAQSAVVEPAVPAATIPEIAQPVEAPAAEVVQAFDVVPVVSPIEEPVMSYEDQLANAFATRLSIVDGKLVIAAV